MTLNIQTTRVQAHFHGFKPIRIDPRKLSGNRAGQWAMKANGQLWRICFRFKDGAVYDVEITNYHKG